jgi:hypothetical protein
MMNARTKADPAPETATPTSPAPAVAVAPTSPEPAPPAPTAACPPAAPGTSRKRVVIRRARGRLGGSFLLDAIIQRARAAGRRIKPLDGDLRSRTLRTQYPATDAAGQPLLDGASWPASENQADNFAWLDAELNAMVVDGVSRGIDFGGGDRVVQEFVRDLNLVRFCRRHDIGLTSAFLLGPDAEDFSHVMEIFRSGDLEGSDILLVCNEAMVRAGQSPEVAFRPILASPDFAALEQAGAKTLYLKRLPCLATLRERGLSLRDVASSQPHLQAGPGGITSTMQMMCEDFLDEFNSEIREAGADPLLP